MEKDIINLGEITIPNSWDEITLKQFQDVERYYSDKDRKFDAREVLHIFTDKTVEEIDQLPMEITEILMNKLMFLQDKPKEDAPSNKVIIDGEEYIINVMEKLKTGEYISIDTVLKADKYDYASILAIICRKKGEIYDSKFEAELFEKRKEMWERQPVMKIMPTIAFFLNCYIVSTVPSQLSLALEEELNHIQRHIETSVRNGEHTKLWLKWQMRKLKRLRKYIKSI